MNTVTCVDCGYEAERAEIGPLESRPPCPVWGSGLHRFSEHEQRGEPRIEHTVEVTEPKAS